MRQLEDTVGYDSLTDYRIFRGTVGPQTTVAPVIVYLVGGPIAMYARSGGQTLRGDLYRRQFGCELKRGTVDFRLRHSTHFSFTFTHSASDLFTARVKKGRIPCTVGLR